MPGARSVRQLLGARKRRLPSQRSAQSLVQRADVVAAARAVEDDKDSGRRHVAILYGVNTLGAVLGTLLSTFVLLERYGNRATLWLACAVNLLVAYAARAQANRDSAPVPSSAAEEVAAPSAGAASLPLPPLWFVLFAAGWPGWRSCSWSWSGTGCSVRSSAARRSRSD